MFCHSRYSFSAANSSSPTNATHTQPAGLGYLFAIDWLLDRLTVFCNIPGDLTVTAIVADKVNKDIDAKLGNEGEIDHGDERKVDSATKEE